MGGRGEKKRASHPVLGVFRSDRATCQKVFDFIKRGCASPQVEPPGRDGIKKNGEGKQAYLLVPPPTEFSERLREALELRML